MGLSARLARLASSSPKPLGGMTPWPPLPARMLLALYAHENLGDPGSYPASRAAFEAVAEALARALYPGSSPGRVPTSGGTEGNLLALYAARKLGARRVVYFDTAHYSVAKAAEILGMESLRLPAASGYAADLARLDSVLRDGDVLVVTVGTTETGYVDPVRDAALVASERGALVHVDASFAGPIARFLAPRKLPDRIEPPLYATAVDAHKVLDAPPHAGVLLVSRPASVDMLSFQAPYVPSGGQPGLLGTRAGAPFVAAAYILESIGGLEGLKRLAGRLMELAGLVYKELVESGPYGSPHPPETPVLCLTAPRYARIVAWLRARGYAPYTCPRHGGLRIALTSSFGEDEAWRLIGLLKTAWRSVLGGG